MNIYDLVSKDTIVALVLGLMTLVQITPIKINPWSFILKWIGNVMNKDVLDKIDVLDEKYNSLSNEIKKISLESKEESIINCRIRIIRFGDELLHGKQHTKDHYDQTLKDIKKYRDYCASHIDFENNITNMTANNIERSYKEHLEKRDFLS